MFDLPSSQMIAINQHSHCIIDLLLVIEGVRVFHNNPNSTSDEGTQHASKGFLW